MANDPSQRSRMSYLELVEEFPKNPPYTQFEKILLAARRAKDLHDGDKAPLAYNHPTSPYTALQEVNEAKVLPTYREEEEEPAALLEEEGEDADEEE